MILASASPRRRQLLEQSGRAVTVLPQNVDETWDFGDGTGVASGAIGLARRKLGAFGLLPRDVEVLAADTVVVCRSEVLGKPRDEDDAFEQLRLLAGSEHEVITGVVVANRASSVGFSVTTRLRFRSLTDAEINRYLSSGESMDKAGSYAIQGCGASLVDQIAGSLTNVIGLPLSESIAKLEELATARLESA